MSKNESENMSLQVEEAEAERQGVRSANWLNFDVLVHPDGPTSKTNGVQWNTTHCSPYSWLVPPQQSPG